MRVKLSPFELDGFSIEEIDGVVRTDIPIDNETIQDSFYIDIKELPIKEFFYYYRSPEDCPFARGNWVIEIIDDSDKIFMLKLPKEMTRQQVEKFIKPMLNLLDKKL